MKASVDGKSVGRGEGAAAEGLVLLQIASIASNAHASTNLQHSAYSSRQSSVMHTDMKDSGMAIGVSDLVPIPSVLRTVLVYCESESEEVCEVCDSLMWRLLKSISSHLLQERIQLTPDHWKLACLPSSL